MAKLIANSKAKEKHRKKMRKALQQAGVARNGPRRPNIEDIVPQLPDMLMKLIVHNAVR